MEMQPNSGFRCLACEEQDYKEEDSHVPTPAHLCSFHEEHGAKTKRATGREIVDISTRRPSQSPNLEELAERVRSATSAVEKGLALREMQEKGDLSVPALSQHFGKTDMWAYGYLNLAKLTEPVRRLVEDEELKLGIAREIGRVVPVEEQMDVVKEVQGMTIPEAKQHIAGRLKQRETPQQEEAEEVSSPPPSRTDVELAELSLSEERFPDATAIFLQALGKADRSLSRLLDTPYSTLRDAFSDPQDLAMAKRHLLTSSYRLNEVLELLEAIERSRK
jgi:hypothetical protein